MAASQLARAFGALELLCAHPAGLALQSISDALQMPKSASHRTLAELAALGHVRQDAETSRYLLTTRLVSLAFGFLGTSGLVDATQPILDRLADATGELVRLGVIDGERQVWVAKAQGARQGLRYDPDMGRETPLSCTASGHAWLAALPEDEALALLARQGIVKGGEVGPQAPRTIKEVMARAALARKRGYAWVTESSRPGMSAVAATVLHPSQHVVIGVLSIAGPTLRLPEKRLHELAPALRDAAHELGLASSGSIFFTARWPSTATRPGAVAAGSVA